MTSGLEQGVAKLEPCPLCRLALVANSNMSDLYVRRYGTHYEHPENGCLLAGYEVSPSQIDHWNTKSAISPPKAEGAAPGAVGEPSDEQLADLIPQTAGVLEIEGERQKVCMTRAELHQFVRAIRSLPAVTPEAPKCLACDLTRNDSQRCSDCPKRVPRWYVDEPNVTPEGMGERKPHQENGNG